MAAASINPLVLDLPWYAARVLGSSSKEQKLFEPHSTPWSLLHALLVLRKRNLVSLLFTTKLYSTETPGQVHASHLRMLSRTKLNRNVIEDGTRLGRHTCPVHVQTSCISRTATESSSQIKNKLYSRSGSEQSARLFFNLGIRNTISQELRFT